MPRQRSDKRRRRRKGAPWHGPAPTPLARPPRVDIAASAAQLDRQVFAALDAVADALRRRVDKSLSISELQLLTTSSHLLTAMKSTHRSIRRLAAHDAEDQASGVDALPLTRVQLERCFLALLLADNPARWHGRYRKNAWKALAEKFFRDQRLLGHLEPYREHFGSNGAGVSAVRAFAREMDVSEHELQTLQAQVLGEEMEQDPRWTQWFIPDMPTPGRCSAELTDPVHKQLAELLYPYYDNLSHFSHGGLMGVMETAILCGTVAVAGIDKQQFRASTVEETTLPTSYAAMAFVATLLGPDMSADDMAPVRSAILDAWRPYVCDGLPLGVSLWDCWAREALAAE